MASATRSIFRRTLFAISGEATRAYYRQMSTRSCFARGAHTTRLARAMFVAGLGYHLFDIERLALTGAELADPDLDLGAQPAQSIEAFEQLTSEQLLHRLGKLASLRDRELECFHHEGIIAEGHPGDQFCKSN